MDVAKSDFIEELAVAGTPVTASLVFSKKQ
jgi:hypothetical protein